MENTSFSTSCNTDQRNFAYGELNNSDADSDHAHGDGDEVPDQQRFGSLGSYPCSATDIYPSSSASQEYICQYDFQKYESMKRSEQQQRLKYEQEMQLSPRGRYLNDRSENEPSARKTLTSAFQEPKGIRLGSSWTYWYISSEGTEADWKEGMKPMCTFDHKEQFWGMWNSMKPPSELTLKRELALFRGGYGHRPIWPDWNDVKNADGGRWKIIFKTTELPQIVDNFWRDMMVHCIEERWIPYSGFVNGVSITVKGQCYRIYVWLCSSRPAYVDFVRDRTKELLKDIPCVQMDYITGSGDKQQRVAGSHIVQQNHPPRHEGRQAEREFNFNPLFSGVRD